jgi:PPM family protein phosphatase
MLRSVLEVIPRFGFRVRVGVACEQGLRRDRLQDAFLSVPELGVFAVADGMGGHQAGEVAATTALDEVRVAMMTETTHRIAKRYFGQPDLDSRRRVLERLRRVVERAHARVLAAAQERGVPDVIGTTLDIAWLLRDEVFVAHVGDGRAYVIRTNAVMQLTEDHAAPVAVQYLREEPHTARRNVTSLVHAVGIGEKVFVDTLLLDLRLGDRLLLVTDGVWSAFDDEAELGQLVRQGEAPGAAAALVAHAKRRSFDDRTALVVEMVQRFVRQSTNDSDAMARDIAPVTESALFSGMSWPRILVALTVGVYVELERGQNVVSRATGDRVAYVILEGLVKLANGRRLGSGATLFAECLVGCDPTGEPPICEEPVRAIRIRRDDFQEICMSDPTLAADLYRRLAEHLGRKLGR